MALQTYSVKRWFHGHSVGIPYKNGHYWYHPKPDITAWELNQITLVFQKAIATQGFTKEAVEVALNNAPPEVMRHFEFKEKPKPRKLTWRESIKLFFKSYK